MMCRTIDEDRRRGLNDSNSRCSRKSKQVSQQCIILARWEGWRLANDDADDGMRGFSHPDRLVAWLCSAARPAVNVLASEDTGLADVNTAMANDGNANTQCGRGVRVAMK